MAGNEGEKNMRGGNGTVTGGRARNLGARAGAEAGADFDAAYAHAMAGRSTEAEAICRKILADDPTHAEALHLLGGIAAQSGNARLAIELFNRALAAKPGFAKAHSNLGVLLLGRGEAKEAVDHLEKAIECEPDFATAYTNLGNALHAAGRLDEAVTVYRQGLARNPRSATAHNDLGKALQALGRMEQAVDSYRRTLDIDPGHLDALSNLGNVLQVLGRLDEAVASYRKALAIRPDFAMALANLGNALHIQGKFDEAEECLHRAVALNPDFATAHSNLGILLKALGRYDEAGASLNRALKINPDHAPARANLARLLLLLGDFGRAWEHYAARQSVRNSRRALWQRPLPEDLRGKRLLVLKDQGLGDEIFFLRFAPELKKRGAEISYLANRKIGSIIARLAFIDRVLGEGEEPEAVDFTLSVGDLPLILGITSAADIPPPYPLPVAPERAARMQARLKELGPPPYVGITWRAGTPNHLGGFFKVAPLEGLVEVLGGVRGTLLALQYKPEAGEIEALGQKIGRPVHDLTALNDDLEDMLALLSLLDEYVTVSNTNIYLRAGTGRTSRILVPMPPEYRWMAEGEESPWFPGHRVYRQKAEGSWQEALAALARDLEEALGRPGGRTR